MRDKKLLIIPPNAKGMPQDMALIRLCDYLSECGVNIYWAQVAEEKNHTNLLAANHVLSFADLDEVVEYVKQTQFDLVLHRGWMHRYTFAARLAQEIENIVFYIKDWQNYPREKYKFIYTTDEDFDAIEELFRSGKKIFSHFTEEQHNIWAQRYGMEAENFHFLPEYCNEKNFIENNVKPVKSGMKLVMAGSLPPTCEPELVAAKNFYRMMKDITSCGVYLDVMLLEKNYENVKNDPRYKDYRYEELFNEYFGIKKGSSMQPEILRGYHFGIFSDTLYGCELEKYPEHYEYAVFSKIVLYLEAGLPVLINAALKSIAKIVREHKIGIVFEEKDLLRLDRVLDIEPKKYEEMVQNVYNFRKVFTYNTHTMKELLLLLQN